MINRKSIKSFPMSLIWTEYVAPKPPPPQKKGYKTQSGRLSNQISTVICDNYETVRDMDVS